MENFVFCAVVYMYQTGFRTKHLSNFCSARKIHFVLTDIDKSMHAGMILIDLQKVFDILDQRVLHEKVEHFFTFTFGKISDLCSDSCH